MKVKNMTAKPIGFGSTIILPDDTGTLPQGYGKDHPTVKYYISRKWIKVVGDSNDNGCAASAVNVGVNINTDTNSESGSGNAQNKPVDRMNKEELQALAFERGVEFAETDTRQMLIDKIKAAQSAEK